MKEKARETDLKPLEALYFLNLSNQEEYSLKNVLICLLGSLYRRQILSVIKGRVCLSTRGIHFLKHGIELDALERVLCWSIKKNQFELVVKAINREDPAISLLKKKLIR